MKSVKIELQNLDRVYTVTLRLMDDGVIKHRSTNRKLRTKQRWTTQLSGDVEDVKKFIEGDEGITLTIWGREVKIRRPVDIPDAQS